METYTFLRAFADSWVLLALTAFFVGIIFWAFRPGSKPIHDAAATSIFRNEDKPADPAPKDHRQGTAFKEARK
ncbi:MAG: cbb3-type cytochrome c oxidase subunit 3 [Rhodobacteraceae bacterium]|jgi:cytochrome c oxidase cbb3-type subunit 4|nr:cbb3-type cytochrome c oxidase subunit 3 [Paracoccaceae bacterium]